MNTHKNGCEQELGTIYLSLFCDLKNSVLLLVGECAHRIQI
jgi:hypothetical protein